MLQVTTLGVRAVFDKRISHWLGYMTLTHEIRVQFPARDPCFESHLLPYSKPRGYRSRHFVTLIHELSFTVEIRSIFCLRYYLILKAI